VWWLWVVGGIAVWLVVGGAVAMLVGRSIHLADQRAVRERAALIPAQRWASPAAAWAGATPVARRRSVPLPPVGIGLAAIAVGMQTAGYLLRLNGATGPAAELLSMNAPLALPRMFVALLFAAAAVAAVAGAGVLPGRRTWWLAVALVAGGIAAVKADGNVHTDAMKALTGALGGRAALAVSGLAAVAIVTLLWFLSRNERRDRRRVLGALAGYAFASVVLSAISGFTHSTWYVTATFVEESGEALAGVAFLMAVLVGVAPRLVLPADWALRRELDAQTLDLPDALPGRPGAQGSARG
jgi:hypothetical protein